MRARIAQIATPRKLVATECCVAFVAAVAALLVLGTSALAAALLALCPLSMASALVVVARLERRGPGD